MNFLFFTTLYSLSLRKNLRGKGGKNRLESLQHDLMTSSGSRTTGLLAPEHHSGTGTQEIYSCGVGSVS